jgi:hypothetical protein
MKTALVAAVAMMLTAPALAETMWFDEGCWSGLISSDGAKFRRYVSTGTDVECALTGTVLACADGSVHKMEILPNSEGIMLNGVRLYVVGDENPAICD